MSTKEKEKPGTITRDPELAVMALLDRKLATLAPVVKARVLNWLVLKHGPQQTDAAPLFAKIDNDREE